MYGLNELSKTKENIKLVMIKDDHHNPEGTPIRTVLKDNIVEYNPSKGIIVTTWEPTRARDDFDSGISFALWEDDIKISEKYKDGSLVCYYCDIIRGEIKDDEYVSRDLLVDVIVRPDNTGEIADLDELYDLLVEGKIDIEETKNILDITRNLLENCGLTQKTSMINHIYEEVCNNRWRKEDYPDNIELNSEETSKVINYFEKLIAPYGKYEKKVTTRREQKSVKKALQSINTVLQH